MKVELWDIARVTPYERNPRKNDSAVHAVAASIKEFGWRQPIVVDGGGLIIVGHTRLKAALQLGLKRVPVHVAAGLTPDQVRALRLADNRTAELAEWDLDLLPLELAELRAADFDLSTLGFDMAEVEAMLAPAGNAGHTPADETPDPPAPKDVVTRAGDLWVLDGHRLLCGDSTSAADVDRLMDGKKAVLCATDPPYLVDYTGERPDHEGGNTGGKDWTADYREIDIQDADAFFRGVFANVLRVIAPRAALYCWHAHKRCGAIQNVWEDLGILDHQSIVWVKPTPVFGRVFWHFRHEPCMMGWRQGSKPEHDGSHEFDSVWEIDWEGKARVVGNEHPTQKPVEIFARPMRKHTRPGDICFEPFSGSGSQIIAGEREGRRVYAMEISPAFVDVGVRRWERFSGKVARRFDADGVERPGLSGEPPAKPAAKRSTRKTPAGAGAKGARG